MKFQPEVVSMPRRSVLVRLMRVGAALLATGAVAALALQGVGAAELSVRTMTGPLMMLLLALGMAASMLAIGQVLARDPHDLPFEARRTLAQLQSQLAELSVRVQEAKEACERAASSAPSFNGAGGGSSLAPSDLEPIYQALRELRELTLLSESQRRDRLEQFRQQRIAGLVREAFELVSARQWHRAEQLVLAMESEFPHHNEVARSRNYLNHARKLHEQETVARTVRETEQLISQAAWDHAHARARTLVDGFPDNPQARALLLRVQKERDAFQEITVHRMFDELRNDIDRRMWRRALLHAQRLLEKFPAHPRAEGVRRQLQTLKDNAEIEQRQELEVRIQQLVRAQQFDEAIALSEQVIRRYPNSPQAESLDVLLPRLRSLAAGALNEPGGSVHDYDDDEQPQHGMV